MNASRERLVCLNHTGVDGHVQSSVQNNPRFMRAHSYGTQVSTLPEDTQRHTQCIFSAHRVNDSDTGRWMYKQIHTHTQTHTQRRMTVIIGACLAYFSSFWRPSYCAKPPPPLLTTTITTPSLNVIKLCSVSMTSTDRG